MENETLAVPARAASPGGLARRVAALVSRRERLAGTVYLLLDHSASMADGDKLRQLKVGALRFFAEAWQRRYAVGAVAFSSSATCISGAGRDFWRFQRRLDRLEPDGRTAMASAIRLASWRLRRRRGRRVMLLITDGQPDDRQATLRAAALARAQGIELVVIGTDGADQAFLAALAPKPELLERQDLAEGIAAKARALP